MPIEKLSFAKITNFKLFGKVIATKEEIYNEQSSEGEAYQINITQDYYNQEFKPNDKQV